MIAREVADLNPVVRCHVCQLQSHVQYSPIWLCPQGVISLQQISIPVQGEVRLPELRPKQLDDFILIEVQEAVWSNLLLLSSPHQRTDVSDWIDDRNLLKRDRRQRDALAISIGAR